MKNRVKVTCCSHATPDGKAIMGQEERLRKKFQKGIITETELRHYAFFTVAHKPKDIIVKVFGKEMKITLDEYNRVYKPLGFKRQYLGDY